MGMERYISMASHISDEMKQEEKLCGKANIDDAFDSLVHLVGPEVTARLKEYRITAEINREINDMPEDTRNKLIDIIDNVMVPLSKRKVPAEEFRDTLLNAFTDAGLLEAKDLNRLEEDT